VTSSIASLILYIARTYRFTSVVLLSIKSMTLFSFPCHRAV